MSPDATRDTGYAGTARHGEDIKVMVAVTYSHLRFLPPVGARA